MVLLSCLFLGQPLGRTADAIDPQGEAYRLARELRQEPTRRNHQRLARYLEDYPGSELARQGALVLGLVDFEQSRFAEAGERFRAATGSQWLGGYGFYYLAQAQAELGAFDRALASLEAVSLPGAGLDIPARRLYGDILVRARRPREAVEWLGQQGDLSKTPALLLTLARAQRAAGKLIEAVETLHRIYFGFPLSPEAEPANGLLAELRAELGNRYPLASEALRRTRADTLWTLGAFRGARSAYVDLSVRASEPTRQEARLRAALALYQLGSVSAACEELAKIPPLPRTLDAELRSYRVRCDLRTGTTVRVDTDLAYLAAHFPATRFYQEALQAAAANALRQNDIPRAGMLYRRLVESFPGDSASAEPHWRLAWLSLQEGEREVATRLMEEHLERYPSSPFLSRALYWRGMRALEAGEEPLAVHLFGLLASHAPRDYLTQQAEFLRRRWHGAPAGNDLSLPAWAGRLGPRQRTDPGPLEGEARRTVERVELLQQLGLAELAAQELEAALAQQRHPELSLAQARLALSAQKYARATETLGRVHPAYWNYRLDELPREAWEILFPRLYWEFIERESRRHDLDPYLVAALIRQESRFERDAVSSAGALGLMQLMPGTARALAGVRRLPESRIVDPEFNIRLGTRFLAQLLKRFNGSLEKAVAGYNAGGTRVEEWSSLRETRTPAEFVESIPVTQTREFVYTVLRNYRFYRDLYAAR